MPTIATSAWPPRTRGEERAFAHPTLLFNEAIEKFSTAEVAARQRAALEAAGLLPPPG